LDLYSSGVPADCPTYVADGDINDGWVPFVADYDDSNGEESGGDPTECKCTALGASQGCNVACAALEMSMLMALGMYWILLT
jgi:hypothetical protein